MNDLKMRRYGFPPIIECLGKCGRWHFHGAPCLDKNQQVEARSFPCYWGFLKDSFIKTPYIDSIVLMKQDI